MFGSSGSPSKDDGTAVANDAPSDTPKPSNIPTSYDSTSNGGERSSTDNSDISGRKSTDSDTSPTAIERRRRSSGVSKARDIFSSAKNSLMSSGHPSMTNSSGERVAQSPIAKLSKNDPALGVPQGALNNSAGESAPGPRSTFKVGVTEDKNKKCRRTMEDTHAYLYNFLSTPAPVLGDEASRRSKASLEQT
ncbi:hypothetical protein LTS18_013578, partial [Coniosporium uncinatum]